MYLYLFMYLFMYVCMYACIYLCSNKENKQHVYTYICIIYIYMYTYTHIHTCIHIFPPANSADASRPQDVSRGGDPTGIYNIM